MVVTRGIGVIFKDPTRLSIKRRVFMADSLASLLLLLFLPSTAAAAMIRRLINDTWLRNMNGAIADPKRLHIQLIEVNMHFSSDQHQKVLCLQIGC